MSELPAKILLATDGSEEASAAARTAAELSRKTGAELHVVHVGSLLYDVDDTGSAVFDPEIEERAQTRLDQEAQSLLDEQIENIKSEGGTVTQAHMRPGDQTDTIVRLAEEIDAGMIIMGSRGRGGIRRALMGSVSENVVLHAHCPVLVVRGGVGETFFPTRIVLAIDGSHESEAAAATTADLAKRTGSELHIVHTATISQSPYPSSYSAEHVESFFERKFLEDRAQQLKEESGAEVHTHFRIGKPDKEIVELAEEVDAGLIALGSRGHGGVKRALMGSVSDAVVRHAQCPVLVVRTEHVG